DFHAKISGFGGNDVIDLGGMSYSGTGTDKTATISASTLTKTVNGETFTLASMTTSSTVITVTENGQTATLTLKGDYTGHSFTFSSDGHGGTIMVDPLSIDSGATLELA